MFTHRGAAKLRDAAKTKNVGMVDAWLNGRCFQRNDGGVELNCYGAQMKPIPREWLGGFVPDWYEDDDVEDAVDPAVVEDMSKNVPKYNAAGCARGGLEFSGKAAWMPLADQHDDASMVRNCLSPYRAKDIGYHIDPCHHDSYPIPVQSLQEVIQKYRESVSSLGLDEYSGMGMDEDLYSLGASMDDFDSAGEN